MKFKIYQSLLLVFIISSCALTKSQVKSVNKFAKLTESYSAYPQAVVEDYVDTYHDVMLMDIETFGDANDAWKQITKVADIRKEQLDKAKELDLSIKIIDKYAQNLKLLTSEDFHKSLEDQTDKLGTNLDTLISRYNEFKGEEDKLKLGIGKLAGEAILAIGKTFVKAKQAKYVKEYVTKSDTLITSITSNIQRLMNNQLANNSIPSLKGNLKRKYITLFGYVNYPSPHEPDSIKNYARALDIREESMHLDKLGKEASDTYLRLLKLESTAKTVAKSISKMGKAHNVLAKEVQTRRKLKEVIPALVEFGSALSDVHDAYSDLKETED